MPILKTTLAVEMPTFYALEPDEASDRGLLVLHGYSDHALAARKRLLGSEPVPGFTVFAPSALFPTPVQKDDKFKEAYSWYFRDAASGHELISPETAARLLLELIEKAGLSGHRWTVLGFSQGGFFAPHLVRAGLQAQTLISVGAGYRVESYDGLQDLRVHALHGEDDTIVPLAIARSSYDDIRALGIQGDFHSFPGLGHTLNAAGRAFVRGLLDMVKTEG